MVKSLVERKHQSEAQKWPFRSSTLMDGPPDCSLESIQRPRLRQCRFARDSLSFVRRLDGGLNGYCWLVKFGEEGPFVLKLFWDRYPSYAGFAPRVECRNAALLQIMEEAIKRGVEEDMPVLLGVKPDSWISAVENMESFSDEHRADAENLQQLAAAINVKLRPVTSMPRVRQCYGWLHLDQQFLLSLPKEFEVPTVQANEKVRRTLLGNSYDPDEYDNSDYTAIVYEYIEPAENRPRVVEDVFQFFWLAGFASAGSLLARKWQDSVLLDMSDIVSPNEPSWQDARYRPFKAANILIS